MTTRRAFLQGSLAASGLALTGMAFRSSASGLAALAGDAGSHLPLYAVIYDRGIATSAAFGAAARRLGFSTHATDGDITDLWTRHLVGQWRKNPVAIAGLTSYAPLFCLERFGWDHGMRVVFRAKHRLHSDGSVAHQLAGPASMLRAFEAVASRHEGYGACMAGVLGRCPQHPTVPSTASVTTPAVAVDRRAEPLYSWVIAPHVRATSGRTTIHSVGEIA